MSPCLTNSAAAAISLHLDASNGKSRSENRVAAKSSFSSVPNSMHNWPSIKRKRKPTCMQRRGPKKKRRTDVDVNGWRGGIRRNILRNKEKRWIDDRQWKQNAESNRNLRRCNRWVLEHEGIRSRQMSRISRTALLYPQDQNHHYQPAIQRNHLAHISKLSVRCRLVVPKPVPSRATIQLHHLRAALDLHPDHDHARLPLQHHLPLRRMHPHPTHRIPLQEMVQVVQCMRIRHHH